jgi:hypothetical protein
MAKRRGKNYQHEIDQLTRQLEMEQAEAMRQSAVAALQKLESEGKTMAHPAVASARISLLRAEQRIARLKADDRRRAAARRSKNNGGSGLGIDLGFIKL